MEQNVEATAPVAEKLVGILYDDVDSVIKAVQEIRGTEDEFMVTLAEAAKVLNCDIQIYWSEVKNGKIPGAKKLSGKWFIPAGSLVNYTCPDKITAVRSTLASSNAQLERAKEILRERGLLDELAEVEAAAKALEDEMAEAESGAAQELGEEIEDMEFDDSEVAEDADGEPETEESDE